MKNGKLGIFPELGPFGTSIAFRVTWGDFLLDMRTNYVPVENWGYFNVHRSWVQGYELQTKIGSDNHVYSTEIPKNQDSTLNWSEAVTYYGGQKYTIL